MFDTHKSTIFIASTPRSGSTVLMDYIKINDTMDRKCFFEPDYKPNSTLTNFIQYFDISKYFIIKAHIRNLFKYPDNIKNYLEASDDVYRVKISRSNLTDQIASYYIALIRGNKWHYYDNEYKPEIIAINKSIISDVIKHIIDANKQLDSARVNFDVAIDYEHVRNFKTTKFNYRTPIPINNDELKHTINAMLYVNSDR